VIIFSACTMKYVIAVVLLLVATLTTATVQMSYEIQLRDSIPCFSDENNGEDAPAIYDVLASQVTNVSDVVELSKAMSYYFAELNGGRHPCDAARAAAVDTATLDAVPPLPDEVCELLAPLSANHPLMACLRWAERGSLGSLLFTVEEEAAMMSNAASQYDNQ
jgi:hypothetical protein